MEISLQQLLLCPAARSRAGMAPRQCAHWSAAMPPPAIRVAPRMVFQASVPLMLYSAVLLKREWCRMLVANLAGRRELEGSHVMEGPPRSPHDADYIP